MTWAWGLIPEYPMLEPGSELTPDQRAYLLAEAEWRAGQEKLQRERDARDASTSQGHERLHLLREVPPPPHDPGCWRCQAAQRTREVQALPHRPPRRTPAPPPAPMHAGQPAPERRRRFLRKERG